MHEVNAHGHEQEYVRPNVTRAFHVEQDDWLDCNAHTRGIQTHLVREQGFPEGTLRLVPDTPVGTLEAITGWDWEQAQENHFECVTVDATVVPGARSVLDGIATLKGTEDVEAIGRIFRAAWRHAPQKSATRLIAEEFDWEPPFEDVSVQVVVTIFGHKVSRPFDRPLEAPAAVRACLEAHLEEHARNKERI